MRSFNNGVWTSEIAVTNTQELHIQNKAKVLEYLKSQGDHGATDQEIEGATGIPGNSERPARLSLVKAHKVADSGRWRPTRAGLPAIVWVAV